MASQHAAQYGGFGRVSTTSPPPVGGHEMMGDDSIGGGSARHVQMVDAKTPVSHVQLKSRNYKYAFPHGSSSNINMGGAGERSSDGSHTKERGYGGHKKHARVPTGFSKIHFFCFFLSVKHSKPG